MQFQMPSILLTWLLLLLGICFADELRVHDTSFQPDYVLVATAQNITINCQTRYSVVFNGTSPGPSLAFRENQTTWVRVYNQIKDQNVTVHWHGLSQRTAPFSDGTPLVSQWPIAPSNFFDYEIRPDVGSAGTYFYHSHVEFQAVTAHGALIVEDCGKPPYEYDDEIIVALGEHYPKTDRQILDDLHAKPFRWSGEPEAILFGGRSGNKSFSEASHDSCKPALIKVKPDKTYRMRFIGGTAMSLVVMAFEDHHDLTIIEADGSYTKAASTDRLQVGSGQRYSILLKTKSAKDVASANKTNFWIQYETRGRPTNVTGWALIQYDLPDQAEATLPATLPSNPVTTIPDNPSTWMEYTLQPLQDSVRQKFPKLSEVTRTIYLNVKQVVVDGNVVNGSVNGSIQWAQAAKNVPPILIGIITTGISPSRDAALANDGWDPTTQTFPAAVGEVIDIVWQGNSGQLGSWDVHPMHTHGTHIYDLGSGNNTYDAAAVDAQHFADGSFVPALRDTTMLYRYAAKGEQNHTAGWRAWRVRVTEDDIGAWVMHCHVLQHMMMGMQTVWVLGTAAEILKKFPSTPYVNGYLTFGGNAYGNATYDPLVMHHF
ncbi:uncharacterized protein PgNI_09088 [Pyricularia grisea]|uniref:L-ascorbate oxidase n=1 Tax=Pyricularia grisea TaxID=148305 RepID=A0A6P8ATP7_PYRGI|nr:uncharacterized protein PgNI_09088 [Pyricularia grisea]TLD05506.1 hypothetical protein PgNI_09088 [Pyricularia grisea]